MNEQHPYRENDLMMTRRQLLGKSALGLGGLALSQMLGPKLFGADGIAGGALHHPAKAKRIIYLFMSGGPSQHDMWD